MNNGVSNIERTNRFDIVFFTDFFDVCRSLYGRLLTR